jgi:hypothetical protein
MSRGKGSVIIPVAVFLAILLIILPASADNVTPSETTVATNLTMNTTVPTTVAPVPTANTTYETTVTPSPTTNTTSPATVAPVNTTVAVTRPPTVITTANPTVSGTEPVTTGSVNVYSSPAGASILIDGVYAGTTPKTVNGVPAGNHILRLTLSGYNDYEGSIYVIPGQPAQGYGTLQPLSHAGSAAPTPVQTVIVPVIVPVATATPAQDPGLLGNSTVITAIIGAIAVIIGSAATIFNHVKPPKKE